MTTRSVKLPICANKAIVDKRSINWILYKIVTVIKELLIFAMVFIAKLFMIMLTIKTHMPIAIKVIALSNKLGIKFVAKHQMNNNIIVVKKHIFHVIPK